ncbi:bacteriorhodopsin [Spirosoma jeollabukense]
MDVTNTFIPTAGVVGLLPMVTYFFLVVTMFAFIGNFIFTLTTQSTVSSEYRVLHALTAVIAVIAGASYYVIQSYYHNMLAELATVTDINDRQTLIRESYSAIGQYRYMAWAVTTPLLLIQVVFVLKAELIVIKRQLTTLLTASFFMVLAGYIGHQQLSFDNEVLAGPKLIWGAISALSYVVILLALYRLWKQFIDQISLNQQRVYRQVSLIIATFWGVYLLGYVLTVVDLDFNWIHIVYTIGDIATYIGVGLILNFGSLKTLRN